MAEYVVIIFTRGVRPYVYPNVRTSGKQKHAHR